jgi:hypothetical protein
VISIRRTVETEAELPLVFTYLSDFTSTTRWDPHTVNCRQLDPGPVEVGTRYDNTQRLGPIRTTLRYQVVDLVRDERIALFSETRSMQATDRMDFAERPGGGTTVTYTATFRLKGAAKLAEPVLRRVLGKVGDDGEAGMRKCVGQLVRL